MAKLTEEQKQIIRLIEREAKLAGIDPDFAVALANLESGFRHIPAEVPEGQPASSAFGPFQVTRATAKANGVDYEDMIKSPELAVRTGIMNLVRHANNPDLGGDPMRIAAAHRLGENSQYAKTGDTSAIDKNLANYLATAAEHFPDQAFPNTIYVQPASTEADASTSASQSGDEEMGGKPLEQPDVRRMQQESKNEAAGMGALIGTTLGAAKAPAFRVGKEVLNAVKNLRGGNLNSKDLNDVMEAIARVQQQQATPTPISPPVISPDGRQLPAAEAARRSGSGGENWQKSLTGISTPGAQMDKSSLDLAKGMQKTIGIGGEPGFTGGSITGGGLIIGPRDAAALQRQQQLAEAALQRQQQLAANAATRQEGVQQRLQQVLDRKTLEKEAKFQQWLEKSRQGNAVQRGAQSIIESPPGKLGVGALNYGLGALKFGSAGAGIGYNLQNIDQQLGTGPLGNVSAATSGLGALASGLSLVPSYASKMNPAAIALTGAGQALGDINRGDYEGAKGTAYLGALGLLPLYGMGAALMPTSELNEGEQEELKRRRKLPATISP